MKNAVGFLARQVTFAALLCGLLTACVPAYNPPPGYKGGFLWDQDKSRTITVEVGDTVYTLSRRYDVPSKVIIARNGLTAPYTLTAGQTLVLDPTRTHTVVKGDTLSQLAATYNVEMRLLASANDLTPPYVIRVGQELWIPDPFTIAAAPTAKVVSEALPEAPPPVSAERVPRSAIQTEELPPPPGSATLELPTPTQTPMSSPVTTEVQPGPSVTVPPVASAPIASAPVASAPAIAPASPPPSPAPAAAEPEVAVAVPPAPLSEPPARSSARFSWPLRGKIIAGFGDAGKGLHNDGINIAAPAGTQVRAADNGVVAYAGNELKGFGNLLLIKHADGWTTAYAHNDKLLVKRGDEVKQGQVIAVVGKTGNVDSPQLHFEVRKGTQALDPSEYLEK
jgi:murein DD-endopeptidase MepM/ murein hydrolase activator NlpD